ncbi:MAG: UDP-N-acetylmuramoyl-tripeptide--D-alanyl-D-alanine ligase, partial [Nocardioidaceae bacterium]
MTIDEVARVVDGRLTQNAAHTEVIAPAFLDSRAVVPGGLFVAVQGEYVDGHDYAAAAVSAGAAAALLERDVGVPGVIVANVVEALGLLAHFVISSLPAVRVVALTGSQGKTTVKDIVAQLLESAGVTVAPEGSFNNELGVPLTALRASENTRFLVVEMGARGSGHIEYLASMVRPEIGAVLNVGVAHLGEFGSREAIGAAKGELVEALPPTGVAVLNADDRHVLAMAGRTDAKVRTFGEAADADVRVTDIDLDQLGRVRCTLLADGVEHRVSAPLVGKHQGANVAAAVTIALSCGVPFGVIPNLLAQLMPRSRWRMEVSETPVGITVINDAYNANPDSMKAALQTLAELSHQRGANCRAIAVLGEMRELGGQSEDQHDAIGRLVVRLGIDQLIVVGEGARSLHQGASLEGASNAESVWVPDVHAAVASVSNLAEPDDIVLIKAYRAEGLERVA